MNGLKISYHRMKTGGHYFYMMRKKFNLLVQNVEVLIAYDLRQETKDGFNQQMGRSSII